MQIFEVMSIKYLGIFVGLSRIVDLNYAYVCMPIWVRLECDCHESNMSAFNASSNFISLFDSSLIQETFVFEN